MTIDEAIPFHGPCGICGDPDARHRLFDAIQERVEMRETVEFLAEDYDLPVEIIEQVLDMKAYDPTDKHAQWS